MIKKTMIIAALCLVAGCNEKNTITSTLVRERVQVECDKTDTIRKVSETGDGWSLVIEYAEINTTEDRASSAIVELCDGWPESVNSQDNYCPPDFIECVGSVPDPYCRSSLANHTDGKIFVECSRRYIYYKNGGQDVSFNYSSGYNDIRLTY